jgi:hypothetical protein
VAALFSRSCAFRLSAFARLTGLSSFFGGGTVSYCGKHMLSICIRSKTPNTYAKTYRGGPRGTPAGQTGPWQCSGTSRAGSRGNARLPRTQRLWGPRPNYRPTNTRCPNMDLRDGAQISKSRRYESNQMQSND